MPDREATEPRVFGARTLTVSSPSDERVEISLKREPKKHAPLPLPPSHGNMSSFDRFIFSPDESIIIADRKVVTGINEAFVFERVSGLHFRLADRTSLNERLWRKYGHPQNSASYYNENSPQFVLFQHWEHGSRYAVLACNNEDSEPSIWYLVMLDTRIGVFSGYQRVKDENVSTKYVG